MGRRRSTRGAVAFAALAALCLLPAAAAAVNPANSFVIGWQQYTKTGQSAQDRFITWQITSGGSLSSTPVYTSTSGFNPVIPTTPGSWYNAYDRENVRHMQVSPDGRTLFAYGGQGSNYVIAKYGINANGTLTSQGSYSFGMQPVVSYAISPNGKFIYAAAGDGLHLINLTNGTNTIQPAPTGVAQGGVAYVAASANSRYLIWSTSPYTSPGGYGVYAIADDGTLTAQARTGAETGLPSISPNGSTVVLINVQGNGPTLARTFDQATGTFGTTLTRSQPPTGYWLGNEGFWSTDSRYLALTSPGGGIGGSGCIYSCGFAATAEATASSLTGRNYYQFDNGSNDSATTLGKFYTPRGAAQSPDGDTIYRLSVQRSSYRSYTHRIESYSFRNGVLTAGGSITTCSDYYDAGNSQTPGRGDNCGGTFEIASTRPSLNVTALTASVDYTNQTTWTYSMTFNASVTGLTKSDFTLGGTAAGFAVSGVTGSGAGPYTVTIAKSVATPSEGTFILRLQPNSVSDAQGNTGPAASFADALIAPTVTYDVTAPAVTITPPDSPLNTTTPVYTLNFSEPIRAADLATSDFSIPTGAGKTDTFSVTSVTPNTGNVSTASVTLTGTSSAINGDLTLQMLANGVRDRAGNNGPAALAAASAAVSFTPNNTAVPTVVGTLGTGETLSVGGNTWTGLAPITYAYQWQSSEDGTSWSDVAGATASTYKIPTTGGGLRYRVQIIATNARGSSSPVVSAGRGPATISPVLLVQQWASPSKASLLTIRSDGALDAAAPTSDYGGMNDAQFAVATPDSRFVYVISKGDDKIYAYKTDAGGGLIALSTASYTVGDQPVSAAISGDGAYLYVVNRGPSNIGQYAIGRNGELTALSPATVTTPSSPTMLVANPAGTRLYVVTDTEASGNANAGRLRAYSIAGNGQLSAIGGDVTIRGGTKSLAFAPSGTYLYTAYEHPGTYGCGFLNWDTCHYTGGMQHFEIGATGAATLRNTWDNAPDDAYSILVSPDGSTVWTVKVSDGTLVRYDVNPANGSLSEYASNKTYDVGVNAWRLATSPDGAYLYVTGSSGGERIYQYAIGADGLLTPLSPNTYAIGRYAIGPAWTPKFGVMAFDSTNTTLTSGVLRAPAGSIDYTLTFTRPITGLDASDFDIGGTAQGMSVGTITGSGAGPYTFTVSAAGNVNGTVELTLKANSVTDRFGTAGPSTATLWSTMRAAPSVTLAYAPPTVSTFTNTVALTTSGSSGTPTATTQAIDAGEYHYCAIVDAAPGNAVKCWGANTVGQLGDGTTQQRTGPVTAIGVTNVTALEAHNSTTCALIGDGTAKCWGQYVLKEDGTLGNSSTPQTVPGLSGATAIYVAGGSNFCAIVGSGATSTLRCWGYNSYGQLGDGTETTRTTPTLVSNLTGVTDVAMLGNSTCASLTDQTVKCWGYRIGVGNNPSPDRYRVPATTGITGVSGVFAGAGNNVCVIYGTGASATVGCMGTWAADIVGSGRTGAFPSPVAIPGVNAVDGELYFHTCYLSSTGTVKCAGANAYGERMNGTTSGGEFPSLPAGITTATQPGGTVLDVAGGRYSTCVLLSTREVKCAGLGNQGQLGRQLATGVLGSATALTVNGLDNCSATGTYKIDFQLTFGASVTGLTCTDIANTGTSSGWSAQVVSGTGAGPYVVRMTSNTLNEGTVIPTLAADSVQGSVSPGPATTQSGPTQTLALPVTRGAPLLSAGTVSSGATLTVTPPTFGASAPAWDGSPTPTLSYQWQVSGDGGVTWANGTGTGATGTSYTVPAGDATKRHRVAVTAANLLGTATEYSRQATTAGAEAPGAVKFVPSGASTAISGTSATFAITFSHVPIGLAANDFTVTGTAAGWSVQSLTGSGIGPYQVTVGGSATGAGTVGLSLKPGAIAIGGTASYPVSSSVDAASEYSVTRTPPSVAFFSQTAQTATTRTFNLTFDAAIDASTLAVGDFTVGGTATGWTVTAATGSGAGPYTVSLTGSGAGTVIPSLTAGSVADAGGTAGPSSNAVGATSTAATWTEPSTPTNASSLTYTLAFSEAVTGLASGDLTNAGTATGCSFGVAGSGSTYTITVSSCSTGTVVMRLATGAVATVAGSIPSPDADVDAAAVTRDTAAPTITSFTATTPSNATSLAYTLQFGEAVTGLTAADFTLSGSSTFSPADPDGWRVSSVTGSGAGPYTVIVSGTNPGVGTVTPTLAAGGVSDRAGNTGPAAGDTRTGTSVTSDRVAPTMSGLTPSATNVNGTTITFTLTTGEAVSGLTASDFQLGGTSTGWAVSAISPASGSASSFTVTLTGTSPTTGTVTPTFRQNAVQDAAGNLGPAASQTGGTVTYDTTAPAVSGFTADAPGVRPAGTATFTLTFAESVTGITASDFANTGTAGSCTFAPGADSGSTRTVTVSACTTTTNGSTVIPRFAANGATDAAGNTGPAAAATATETAVYDGTAPAITSGGFTAAATAVNGTTITYSVTFSENVTGFDASDVTVGGTSSGWTVTSVTGSDSGPYTITLTGSSPTEGTVTASFNTNGVTDGAGNAGASSTQTSPTTTYDVTAPTSTATFTGGPSAGGQDNDATPTFAFGGAGAGETHQCRIDSGSWATCASPYTVGSDLSDGSHTIDIRTADAAGNGSATTVSRTWTVDTTPPAAASITGAVTATPYPTTNQTSRSIPFVPAGAVEVTSGIPFSSTTATTASIVYNGPLGATVRCKVDSGAWATCAANPLALTGLATGSHTVLFDTGAGTLETKVTWTVVASGGVDTRNPVDYYLGDGTTPAAQCRIDGGSFAACSSPYTPSGLAAGDHTATIATVDAAGNRGSATTSWNVDLTPPSETIAVSGGPAAAGSSSDATPTFTFPSAAGLSTQCRIDSGAWAACTSPYTIAPASAVQVVGGQPSSRTFDADATISVDTASATLRCTVDGVFDATCDNPLVLSGLAAGSHTVTWDTGASTTTTTVTWEVVTGLPVTTTPSAPTYSPDTALADGSHTFDVRYVDPAGNGGTAGSRTWTVDTTRPANPSIGVTHPTSSSSDVRPQFSFSGAGAGETYECKIDSDAWAACTSPYTSPTLADGSHTFQVRGLDAAGNASATPASQTWTVDTTAPTSTVTATRTSPASSPSSSTSASITLSGAAGGETYECSLDGAAWSACTSPATASSLTDGEHTLRTRTRDAAGNTGPIQSTSWTVDTSSPATPPAPSGLPSGGTTSTSASGTLPAATSGSTLQCKLDSGSWTTCPDPLSYTGLVDGAHTLQTREIDGSGNTGPVTSTTWTVDTAPPVAPTTGGGPSTTTDTTPTVTFTGEPTSTFECRVDGGGWTTCTSPYTPAALSPGSHTIDIRQVDAGGNAGPIDSRTVTVDGASSAVEVVVSGVPTSPTNSTSASLAYSATSGTVRCTVDGAAVQSPCPGAGTLALTGLAAGDHVVVFDTGASTPSTTVRWTIDTTPPAAPTVGAQPANPTSATTGSFAFSGDPNVTFECAVDGGGYSACTTPFATGTLAAGSHTFSVKAVDRAGNRSSATSVTWTIDTTPPTGAAVFTATPAATTTAQTATFAFTLGADGASAQCSTNGSTWTACTSPHTLSGLAEGSHTLYVRTLDAAGNVSTATPTSYTWLVDLGPPTGTPTFSSQPAATSSAIRGTFAFTGATSPETYECRVDAGTWVACTSPYTTPALADGPHTFNIRIVDPAGNIGANVGSATWSVDTTAPTAPTVTGGSTGTIASTNGTLEFAAPPAGSTAQCRIDEGAWAACTSPKAFTGLADGYHTAEVRFVDEAGNIGSASSRSWTSDTTPPAVVPTIPTQIPATTSDTSIIIGVNAVTDRGETVECRLDGGSWGSCTPPVTYSGLAEGSHTFSTRTVDGAGNSTAAASATWTVDTMPPSAPTIESGVANGATVGPQPTITISTQAGDVVECRIDSTGGSPLAFGPCPTPYTVAPALPAGAHTIEFRTTDAAGNVGPTTTVPFTVETTPPPVPTIASGPTGTIASSSATFTFTDTEAGATFLCSIDGGAYTPCASPKTFTGLADGAHTFGVKAVDANGNASSAVTRTFTTDTLGPASTATITGTPASPSASSTATLTLTPGEAGVTFECSVNGAAYAACTSPVALSGLGDGSQTVRVRQVDALGNPGAATTATWTTDTTAPVAAPTVSGAPSGITATTSYSITFTGEAGTTFQCSTDGGATWATCTSPQTASGLADGTQRFAVRQLDTAGNASPVASYLWVVDTGPPTTPPTTGTTPPLTGNAQQPFTFTGDPGSTFECSIDGATYTACTSPFTPPSSLAPGAHTLDVRQVDPTGAGPAARTTFTVDPAAPATVQVASVPTSPTSTPNSSIQLTVEAGATLYCGIDGGTMGACTAAVPPSPMPAAGQPVTYTLPLTGLADGNHGVSVYQVDATGTTSPTTGVVWTVDTTGPIAPAVGSRPAAYTSSTSASVSFTAEPGATTQCSLDGGAFTACTSPVTFSGLGEGQHTVDVRSTDAAGNIGAGSDTVVFTVDTTPPTQAPTITAAPDAVSSASVETFSFTLPVGPLEAANAQCSYDGGAWTACASPYTVSPVAVGEHTLAIRPVDAAGNVGTASASHTWERIVPSSPPAGTPGITLNGGAQYATSTSAIVGIVWPSGAWYIELSNDPSFSGAQRDVISTAAAWTLGVSTGDTTVYARFLDQSLAPVGAASYSASITVDTVAPVVASLAFSSAKGGVGVTPSMSDVGSGLATWQATTATATPGAALPASTPTTTVAMQRPATVYVRAVDAAGNTSGWFSATPSADLLPVSSGGGSGTGIVVADHVLASTAPVVDQTGAATVPVTCQTGGGTCQVTVGFRQDDQSIGSASVTLPEGTSRAVPVRLTPAAQQDLGQRGALGVTMVVRARTSARSETRGVAVTLEAPLAPSIRFIRGKRATTKRTWVLAQCMGAAPQHCTGRVTLVTVKRYRIGGAKRRVVLGSAVIRGLAGTPLLVPIKLNANARTILTRYSFLPVRANWRLSPKVKPKRGRTLSLSSRAFRIPSKITRVRPLLVRQSMLPTEWRWVSDTADVGAVFRGRPAAQIDGIKRGLDRFLQITYAKGAGEWLTTEGYAYRDAASAQRGLLSILDVAKTRGPIETARAFQFFTLPLPAEVQGKGILVSTQTAAGPQTYSFWCWRQVNVVFCNRAPERTAFLLSQVATQQVPIIKRVIVG